MGRCVADLFRAFISLKAREHATPTPARRQVTFNFRETVPKPTALASRAFSSWPFVSNVSSTPNQPATGLRRVITSGVVLGNPDITTAGLLENFRDAGEWDYLCQLAATDIPNLKEDDTKLANRLFIDSVDQLASANRRRGGAALRERADTGAFDDDLKAQLRAHFPYVD